MSAFTPQPVNTREACAIGFHQSDLKWTTIVHINFKGQRLLRFIRKRVIFVSFNCCWAIILFQSISYSWLSYLKMHWQSLKSLKTKILAILRGQPLQPFWFGMMLSDYKNFIGLFRALRPWPNVSYCRDKLRCQPSLYFWHHKEPFRHLCEWF